jgi:acyl transferase domain-containing protein/NADPH:quinone reductase-like Zn-dependent oxidoreductase/acyl carrier protein/short-subunit dehydrogenase
MYEDPIAIVGAACRLPGAAGLAAFWDVLSSGRDAVTEIPDGRWSKEFYYHPNPAERGKSYTWAAGVIDGVDRFDAAFFGISPREADQIDPQQRLLLELAWEALEDAGIPAGKIAGSGAGVYIGASSGDYGDIRTGDPAGGDAYFMTGVTASILANRVSYIFDLHGPSFSVDTACSSSLVALDLACRAIRDQRTPLALVGGVSLLLSPFPFIGFCRASMLSPSGRCFAFDARANGYVRAEGGGMVVLKPLSRALADGDAVRAVILDSGVNSDGRTMGLSLPNGSAQAGLLRMIYGNGGIAPDRLSFVEAHGTGTPAGDPIELGALGEAVARRRGAALPVGSVKTNVGHLEAASGMAGLIKAVLALEHRQIPPSIHFETPNPRIPFDDLNIGVATRPIALAAAGELLAGVNSFGFGGTNAHVVLACAPPAGAAAAPGAALPPLLLSARSEAALKALAGEWSARLADAEPETAIPLLNAAARRRDHHRHRLVAHGGSPFELAEKLDALAATHRTAALSTGVATAGGKLAFVFSGNGVQRPGMARDALAHSPVFRATLDRLDACLAPRLGWSIVDRLAQDHDPRVLARTDVAQPLLFAVQIAIVEALRAAGIEAAAFMGHSVGEIAAAWAAGALSLQDACAIIVARSQQQERTAGSGGMAALGLSAAEAREAIAALDDRLEIAAINSAMAVTVAGPRDALARLRAEAEDRGWRYTPLDLDYAFHSAALDPIERDLIRALDGVAPQDCGGRFVSTVEGAVIAGSSLDGRYWWRNIREPVRFKDAVDRMIADDVRIFLEIGPNPALQSYIREALKTGDAQGRSIATLTHRGGTADPFPRIAAECHVAGGDLSRAAIFDGPADIRNLPAYPWQREPYWFRPTAEGLFLDAPVYDHPLLGFRRNPDERVWSNFLSLETQPWIGDHRIEGVPVAPGAALLEIALAAGRQLFPNAATLAVDGLEIPRALTIEPGQTRETRVHEDGGRLEISSRVRLSSDSWTLHAVARVTAGSAHAPRKLAVPEEAVGAIGPDALYAIADRMGLNYGPAFRVVRRIDTIARGEAVVSLQQRAAPLGAFMLDPSLLDGALQGLLALLADSGELGPGESFVPSRFGHVRVFPPYARPAATARVRITRIGGRSASAAFTLIDSDGAAIAEIDDCWFQRVRLSRRETLESRLFRFESIPAPLGEAAFSPQIALAYAQPAKARDYDEAALLFDAYMAASGVAALKTLIDPGAAFRVDDLARAGVVARAAIPLLNAILSRLERHEAAAETGGVWRLSAEDALPAPDVIWRTLIDDAPELTAELALAAAADLENTLRTGFETGDLPPALIDHLLYASPSGAAAIARLTDSVEQIARDWPNGRTLRILEIDAGGGVLERRLEPILTRAQIAWDYQAADPVVDTALSGPFDLILSLFALTRRGRDHRLANRLHGLLAPGGLLICAEAEPNDAWEAAFGQRESWWRGDEAPGAAAIRETLDRAGFATSPPSPVGGGPIGGGLWPSSLVIARRDPVPAPIEATRGGRPAIVIADSDDTLAQDLARMLSRPDAPALIIDPPAVADGNAFCAALAESGAAPGILLLPPSSAPPETAAEATARLIPALTVARLAAESCAGARLSIVTRGAWMGAGGAPIPAEAALWGLGRTIMNEIPALDLRLIDVPAGWTDEKAASCLAAEADSGDREREIVWTESGRRALRLRRGPPAPAARTATVALTAAQPGLLDTLQWRPAEADRPGEGEVAIRVEAAGLNFRDVMWAMALLPEEALLDGFSGPTLGLECAGVIDDIGAGVDGLAIGDRVLALAPAALRSRVVTAAHAVARLPDGLGFAEAATIPVAYLTVLYSLGTLARLEAGETVLIHGGAGGVGLAAIHYARHCGATIIATAGSKAKRAFLRHMGVDHVLDSRSLAFADAVRELTRGAGVDVVLNSLSGEAMERSIGLLKPFGRFIELGKRDFMMDTRVGLRPLRQNVAYYAVDIDRLPIARPELAGRLLREIATLIGAGALRPLPYRAFPFAEASDAFRLMQASGHIGKIVLRPEGLTAPLPAPAVDVVRSDRTYLVVGGLSGFGLETARWLADRGARHLALIGRRGGDAPEAPGALANFASRGVEARAFACDAADERALAVTLNRIRGSMSPLAGVVHAAMVVDDGLAADLTAARILRVMAPKLDAARHLDRLTRTDPIEFFVLYSSATTVLGAPGQGSYVAANSALEALAERRRREGLPALAVAWGPIGDVGFLARQEAARDALLRRLATAPMTARDALDALPALLATGAAAIAFAPVRWDAAAQYLPVLASPAFGAVAGPGGAIDIDLKEQLDALPPAEAKAFVIGLLTEEAARIMSSPADRIDPLRPLSDFGMDSLMAVELRLALQTRLGVDVPLVSLSDNTSLSTIATRIVGNLARPEAAGSIDETILRYEPAAPAISPANAGDRMIDIQQDAAE